jgi:hypothetical protein
VVVSLGKKILLRKTQINTYKMYAPSGIQTHKLSLYVAMHIFDSMVTDTGLVNTI